MFNISIVTLYIETVKLFIELNASSSISVIVYGIYILVKFVFPNVSFLIVLSLNGISILANDVFWNASFPIVNAVLEMTNSTVFNLLLFLNAPFPMVSTDPGIVISVIIVSLKAELSILVRFELSLVYVTFSNWLANWNALLPIIVTFSPIMTSTISFILISLEYKVSTSVPDISMYIGILRSL